MSPHHVTKPNGRRYRYYVRQRDAKEHAGASSLPRLPAAELESAVLDQLRSMLRAPEMLADVLPRARELDPTLDEAKLAVARLRLDAIWDQLFPAEQRRIVKLMVEKVIITLFDLAVGPPAFREGQRERLRSVPANPPKTPTTVDQTC